ncbi:MAG: lipase maturation factor family protein [Labilithrix sp.]|nr:lipase maturation factor family protein [Labilithrix sp.]MCW5812331.1 lipase maturation factor family protein [Labilithrix sp.]
MPDLRERPRIARWLADGSSFVVTRTVLLRLLGGVYFVTFLSTFLQGPALIGEHGLLPMRGWLAAIARAQGSRFSGFLAAPSVFWVNASDAMLRGVTAFGMLLALAVVLGATNAAVMLALWAIQFSLYDVGQVFWGYGWEMQLLETGMLAAIVCPLRTWRPFASAPPASAIWLFRWLIARVMLGAGLIKLRGDECWRALTCLQTHYETQPNPSPVSWLLHQLPPWFHTGGVLVNHFVELVAPFLLLGPRRARRFAGACFVGFQAVLIASGNLSFLNWLTIVPALACFDDELVPARWRVTAPEPSRAHRRVALGYAAIVGVLSLGPIGNLLSSRQAMNASFDPLHLVSTYGAFGSVNAVRDEIVLEGSRDGERWEEYELPCKPGDVRRRPCLVSPYHYRLDWQMWFAAMSSYDEEPWIVELVDKLLRGDHAVDPLLARDPFAGGPPPRFVRARLFRYELTTWSTRREGWWRRGGGSEYLRPLSLGDPDLALFLAAHRLR